MKFFQNKTTGQIIGVKSMNELIKHPTEERLQILTEQTW